MCHLTLPLLVQFWLGADKRATSGGRPVRLDSNQACWLGVAPLDSSGAPDPPLPPSGGPVQFWRAAAEELRERASGGCPRLINDRGMEGGVIQVRPGNSLWEILNGGMMLERGWGTGKTN